MIVLAVTVEVADALDLPVGTWIKRTDGTDKGGVGVGVHQPHRSLAVIVLEDDVGVAVTVEVAAALDVPAGERARCEWTDLGVHLAAIATVHQPQVDIAVDLLRDHIVGAVAVDVADGLDVEAKWAIGEHRRSTDRKLAARTELPNREHIGLVHDPQRREVVAVVLPDDLAVAVAVEVADACYLPQW